MKKIFISLAIIISIFFSVVFVFPYFFKDKIIEILKKEMNKKSKTKIDFNNDVALSILKDFPKLSLSIKNLLVESPKGFPSDTLVAVENTRLALDLLSVIKGENIKIHSITVEKPTLNLFVNKEGINNWDIFIEEQKETQKEEKSTFQLNLEKLEIKEGNIIYQDKVGDLSAVLKNYNHTLSGDFTQDIFDVKNKIEIEKLTVINGTISYLNNINLKADADLNIDLKNKKYKFLKNEFIANGLILALDGIITQKNKDIDLNIAINAPEAKFKSFISLIPALYTKDFEAIKADGVVSFVAKAKGTYSANTIPTFQLNTKATNAWFQYPDLKEKVDQINFNLNVSNVDGIKENTQVVVKDFSARMGKNKAAGEVTIQQALSENPFIDTKFTMDLRLEELKNYVPMKGNAISGKMQADIKANGKMVNMKSGAYEKINATGYINAQDMRINSKEIIVPIFIKQTSVLLSANYAEITNFIGKIGENDFNATGKLYNLFSYVFSGGTLKAELNTNSSYLDLNQLMALTPTAKAGESTEKKQTDGPLFPERIDFTLKSRGKQVMYDKMSLNNMKADLRIADQKAYINTLNFKLWEGNVEMKGLLDAKNSKTPNLNYSIKANALSIINTIKNFKWIQNYIPIIDKGLVGDFGTKLNFSTTLGQDFKPDLKTLNLNGILNIAHLELSKFTTLESIQNQLNVNDKNKDVTTLKNLLLNLTIKNGDLQIKPFNFKLGDVPVNIGGTTGLNSAINYTGKIQLPAKLLGGNQKILNNLTANTPFKSIQVNETDKLDLAINIGGTVTNPQLKLNLKNLGKSLKENITNTVKKEIEVQKNKIIEETETKVNEEVKKQRDKIKENIKDQLFNGLFGEKNNEE